MKEVTYGLPPSASEVSCKERKMKEENKKQKELNNTLYKSLERIGKRNNELKVQIAELEKENERMKGILLRNDETIK